METPKITAYLKTTCGWSAGVRAVLAKYNLPYTEKDIIQNPAFRWEMEQKSGQPLSPCVEVNGTMLPDISGDEVIRVARAAVEKIGATGRHRAVLVDEAQDFSDDYWFAVEELLQDSEEGPLYIFIDENQALYRQTADRDAAAPVVD